MNNNTKRLVSLALAGTIISSAGAGAKAENGNDGVVEKEANTSIEYVVKKGDTLGKITEHFYGNANCYDVLAAYNGLTDPNTIYPGEVLVIPNDLLEHSISEYPNYAEDKTYIVQEGDTLYCIVNSQYGLKNQESVDKLATYNNLSDPNRLYIGQLLYIPEVEKLQAVVERDYSAEYNRMGWILNHQNECHEFPFFCHPRVFIYGDPIEEHTIIIHEPPIKDPIHRRILKPHK